MLVNISKKNVLIFLSILFYLNINLLSQEFKTNTFNFVLATGNPNGAYYKLGLELKNIIEKEIDNALIEVVATEGSVQNARLLEMGSAHFALMQSDIASYFYKGERMFYFPSDSIGAILSLHNEAIHIVALKNSNIKKINDLTNYKISIGEEGSGTYYHSKIILEKAGILNSLDYSTFDLENVKSQMSKNKIQAFIFTTSFPSPFIQELPFDYKLISLDPKLCDGIRKNYNFFSTNNYKG